MPLSLRSSPAAPPWPAARSAALVFLTLVAVYLLGLWRGGPLAGLTADATASSFLPAVLLSEGRLRFTVETTPALFRFEEDTPGGPQPRAVMTWGDPADPQSAAARRQAGRLRLTGPGYNLRPTRFPGLYVGTHGVGAGLTALPLFAPLGLRGALARPERSDDRGASPAAIYQAARVAATIITAASAVLLLLAARCLSGAGGALLAALIYGLATGACSTSAQALWQHGPAALHLSLSCLALLRAARAADAGREAKGWALACGAAAAAAVACRPTLALFAPGALWALGTARRRGAFLLGALPIALSLALYNGYYLGAPWRSGQYDVGGEVALAKTGSAALWRWPFAGAAGLLLSPNRGLLVFSPVLGFALWGWLGALRGRLLDGGAAPVAARALRALALVAAAQWLLASCWFDWWGGSCYGPRPLLDSVPLLVLLLAPVLTRLGGRSMRAARGGLALALAWSLVVQLAATLAPAPLRWNNKLLGLWIRTPAGGVVLARRRAEVDALRARGGQVVGEERLNVDLPEHRGRLWDPRDSHILDCLRQALAVGGRGGGA